MTQFHFDDYFYPYRIAGKEFPDEASYRQYGNGMDKEDWRRSNTDSIILALSKAIKEEKKYCRFGISPFGVWRNESKDSVGSATTAGQTNYDDLYADILLWLKEGWIDYVAPQLYWEFGHKAAPYEVLLDWWSKHTYGKHCYIGLGIYRAGSNAAWRDKTQLPRMLTAMRNTPNINGAIYFSSKTFERNPNGWNDSLRENYYKYPAIIPAMNWIDSSAITPPLVTFAGKSTNDRAATINIENKETRKKIKAFIVYRFSLSDTLISNASVKNIIKIIPVTGNAMQYMISPQENANGIIAASIIDFENNESKLSIVQPAGN